MKNGNIETYKNFPDEITKINCFLASDSLIVIGTNTGLYQSNINDNLKNPSSWTKIVQNFSDEISSISSNEDFLVFTTFTGLYEYSFLSDSIINLSLQLDLNNAQNVFIIDNGYWFSEGNLIYFYKDNELINFENRNNILTITKFGDSILLALKVVYSLP